MSQKAKTGIVHTVKEVFRSVASEMNKEFYEIEYEIFPLRAIRFDNVEAHSEEEALELFWQKHPRGIVRSVNDIRKEPELHNPNQG